MKWNLALVVIVFIFLLLFLTLFLLIYFLKIVFIDMAIKINN